LAEKVERVSSSAHPASLPGQGERRGTYRHDEIDAGYLEGYPVLSYRDDVSQVSRLHSRPEDGGGTGARPGVGKRV